MTLIVRSDNDYIYRMHNRRWRIGTVRLDGGRDGYIRTANAGSATINHFVKQKRIIVKEFANDN